MIPVQVFDDFATADECALLAQWTLDNRATPVFTSICGRRSTRNCREEVKYPETAYQIQQRIVALLGLEGAAKAPFWDGIYSGYTKEGDSCFYEKHKDPVYAPNTITLHCNIVVTDNKSGDVVVEEHGRIAMKRGRLVCYPVSELFHEVLPGADKGYRNLWVFGFCLERKA